MDRREKLRELLQSSYEEDEEYEYEDVDEDVDVEIDSDVYDEPPLLNLCNRDELHLFVTLLTHKIMEKATNKGIRIVFDIEPLLFESVFNLYALATYCSRRVLTEENGIVKGSDGMEYIVSYSLFKVANPKNNEVMIVFMREDPEHFWDDFESLVVQPRLIYFIITRGRPELDVSTAVFLKGLAGEVLRDTFLIMEEDTGDKSWGEKIKYIGRVPYDVLLTLPLETIREISRTWTPPPPPNADYLYKKPRNLNELVLPKSVQTEIKRFIDLTRIEGRGSLLLVGLPASGRKTIARTIAKELELPAYHISISSVLSKWVGESEGKLKAFFEGMRARGGVAVFENVEAIFRKQGGEGNVTNNLKTVLYQQMARDDNNFVIVFTSNEDASPELFDSPLLGETKLVIPPPTKEERKKLVRMFLEEIAGEYWDKVRKIVSNEYGVPENKVDGVLYNMYADPFAGAGIGLTSGELYRMMRRILLPTIHRMVKTGKPVDISGDIMLMGKRDYTSRQAKLRTLKERAILLGHINIADTILEIEKEVRIKAIEVAKIMDKYREY